MIERAGFGRTGHDSSRVVFGAAALARMRQEKADEILPVLREFGVNHLDTAADYGDSELRLAAWLAGRRHEFFLATKTSERTGDGARASLERSLQRLGVDQVDLIQLHNLVEEDDWQTAHGSAGAVTALARARDEGLVRFIGVTGHGLRIAGMHRRSLERFDFDSVLLPCNYALLSDGGYRSDFEALVETCQTRRVAVQTIKSVVGAGGPRATVPVSAGTSRSPTTTPSPGRCATCSAAPSCSSSPRVTPTSSAPSWRRHRRRGRRRRRPSWMRTWLLRESIRCSTEPSSTASERGGDQRILRSHSRMPPRMPASLSTRVTPSGT